jgi:hypothetical protein
MRNRVTSFIRSGGRARLAGPAAVLALAVAAQPGCTSVQTDSTAASYLILNSIVAASGAEPGSFSGELSSDVLTLVKKTINGEEVLVPTIFEDVAEAEFTMALRDPGSATNPTTPSPANSITITRFRVNYIRSDGRNTPGVDVPWGFDGGATGTVTSTGGSVAFTLVRIQAKKEAPLLALVANGGAQAISTIAEITFYGTDQAGRSVSVVGRISVNFADWGDPD